MQRQLGNKQVPISKGVFIFDEVKVGLNVQWNSRMDEFIGHSITSEEMSTLHDVYESFDREDMQNFIRSANSLERSDIRL